MSSVNLFGIVRNFPTHLSWVSTILVSDVSEYQWKHIENVLYTIAHIFRMAEILRAFVLVIFLSVCLLANNLVIIINMQG